jgi:hypothetical protein
MKSFDLNLRAMAMAFLLAIGGVDAGAAVRSENFDSATGSPNAYQSPSGMAFSAASSGFTFTTGANAFFSPYIAGRYVVAGCNGCTARTMRVAWPLGQRSLAFGWGTQGYGAVRVTAFRDGLQVWRVDQSGIADGSLFKQRFSRTAANAGEIFDRVEITWPGGGQSGVGYASLLDQFTSTDAYRPLVLDGGGQDALVGGPYAQTLAVAVRDDQDRPVANVSVRFDVADPSEGRPSVVFAATGDAFDVALTGADGIAVASTMTANGIPGALSIAVATTPSVGLGTFALHNVTTLAQFADGFE